MLKFNYLGVEYQYNEEDNTLLVPEKDLNSLQTDPKFIYGLNKAIREILPNSKNKLNIGCGYRPKIGWINLDYDEAVCPDVVRDIAEGLPFDSDRFEEIYSSHVIEHVKDVFFYMYEIWRVGKKGAKVEILAPYCGFLEWAIQPDHLRLMNWGFFDRWKPGWHSVQNEDKQCRGAKFNVLKVELFNEAKEIRYILEVVK